MASYTISFGDVLRQLLLEQDYKTATELTEIQFKLNILYQNPVYVIENARTLFFDFDYELYDESHKKVLEEKILYHYFDYEIGVELPAKFKFNIAKTLREILPYYNKIYKATAKDFDFDDNVDYEEWFKGKGDTTANNTLNSNLHSTDEDTQNDTYEDRLRYSDTPQNQLDDVEKGKYISEYNYNNGSETRNKTNNLSSDTNSTSESTGTNTTDNYRKVKGTNGKKSKAQLLQEYIDAIQNVDLQVIEALKNNFMLLW